MADIGEVQISEKDLGIKPSEKIDPWRDLKVMTIKENAYELSWSKSVTGKRVDFPREDGKLVWGVEIEIPLRFEGNVVNTYTDAVRDLAKEKGISLTDQEIQDEVKKKEGRTWFMDIDKVALPSNIKRIRIVDLSPQEALPKDQRNIDSKRNFWHDKHTTIKLTSQPSENSLVDRAMMKLAMSTKSTMNRSEALQDLFYDVFAQNQEVMSQFRKDLEQSGAEEVLFVHAHGGYDDIIGEQDYEVKGDDAQFQAEGNRIALTEILDKYDQPEKYGAILVNTCYKGKEKPRIGKVPVFRPYGYSGGGHPSRNMFARRNTTLISKPQE